MKLKTIIKNALYGLLPHKYIIFESVPDLSDNSKAVFYEMIRRGYNKKYKLIWLVKNDNPNYPKIKNVEYITKESKKRKMYIILAKCFICCNDFLYTENQKQLSFFLTHGTYVKKPTDYYTMPNEIQYCFSSSNYMKENQAKALAVDLNKMIPLGFPRNDILTRINLDMHKYFDVDFKKTIVWYPTFRQHSTGMNTGSEHSIPIIWDKNNAIELNKYAKDQNILIILKPHFAQDTTKIKSLNLSNIIFIDDDFFVKNGISSYEFIGSCDSMITDYSSVYFDYTLCDRPIGLVWEDYKEYESNPGFALDMDYYMQGGVKIYNLEDFKKFIFEVANDFDSLKKERRFIRDVSNYSIDGKNSERVVDFIEKEACLYI